MTWAGLPRRGGPWEVCAGLMARFLLACLTSRQHAKCISPADLRGQFYVLRYELEIKLRRFELQSGDPAVLCGQTTDRLLQSHPLYQPLRKGIWPDHAPEARKLHGSLRDLRCAATFIEETGVSI